MADQNRNLTTDHLPQHQHVEGSNCQMNQAIARAIQTEEENRRHPRQPAVSML